MAHDFDVFLSYNAATKREIVPIAIQLRDHGLRVFFADWDTIPGASIISAMEDAIDRSRTVAVFLGADGLGPWQDEERRGALVYAVKKKRRLIPALLPGARAGQTPAFLPTNTWVSLGEDGGLIRLVAEITRRDPESLAGRHSHTGERRQIDAPDHVEAELARVFHDLDEARDLLRAVRLPLQDVPTVKTARVFWGLVMQALRDGKVVGGVQALVEEARRRYPANPVFGRYGASVGREPGGEGGEFIEPTRGVPWPDSSGNHGVISQAAQERSKAEANASRSPSGPRVRLHDLRHDAHQLFGRELELANLDAAWISSGPKKTNIISIIAPGGVGKTSLVTEWTNRLSVDGWRGANIVFTYSFYSQGVREQGPVTAEFFVDEALKFMGAKDLVRRNASAQEKGSRLAELIGQQRSLLVLDGLEPLQQPPRKGLRAGELKDYALRYLLKNLAHQNRGLCVLTSREAVYDLRTSPNAVLEWDLGQLSLNAGCALLEFLLTSERIKGPPIQSTAAEREEIWEAVRGHALTLQLLGRYLRRRRLPVWRWRQIRFESADEAVGGGHASRMMAAYERWLAGEDGSPTRDGDRQLAVLRIMGLFDRPADPGSIGALCEAPAIEGVTEPLVGLDAEGWDNVLADLEELGLVSRSNWQPLRVRGFRQEQTNLATGLATGEPEEVTLTANPGLSMELDVHPLVREYFERRVKETSEAGWAKAHLRLCKYLCRSVPYWPEGLDNLQPLLQAVAHGCLAGEMHWVRAEIYRNRILRGTGSDGFYTTRTLGAFGADLGTLACFFSTPWSQPSPSLQKDDHAWLLAVAGFDLRSMGRLAEAVDSQRAALTGAMEEQRWGDVSSCTSNLSESETLRGRIDSALLEAERSVSCADRSMNAHWRCASRTTYADALHSKGRRAEALKCFIAAEEMQARHQPSHPMLYTGQGFRYCELLLAPAEHAAWWATMITFGGVCLTGSLGQNDRSHEPFLRGVTDDDAVAICDGVISRANQTLAWLTKRSWPLDPALDHLTLGRASLYRAVLAAVPRAGGSGEPISKLPSLDLLAAERELDVAVDGLYRAGALHHLPRGLLSRAWLRFLRFNSPGAEVDLREAEETATRCQMPIYLADVHLVRARLFCNREELAKARQLLATLRTNGYHRHDEMLVEVEAVARYWPSERSTRDPQPQPA